MLPGEPHPNGSDLQLNYCDDDELKHPRLRASEGFLKQKAQTSSRLKNPVEHMLRQLVHFATGAGNHYELWRCDNTVEFLAMVDNHDVDHDGKRNPRNIKRVRARAIRVDYVGPVAGGVGTKIPLREPFSFEI